MTSKYFLAGVLGAIAMFLWSFVAHMFTPLAEAGVSEIPNEEAVTAAMQSSIGNTTGFYVFPGAGLGPNATHAEKSKAMEKMNTEYAKKSSGILVYNPPGKPFNFPIHLMVEFASELLQSLLAVFLLAQTRIGTFSGRIAFLTVVGLLTAVSTNISYWNWYGFPTVYTAGYMCIEFISFIVAGAAMALVLKNTRPA
jgi:hypothetical protein